MIHFAGEKSGEGGVPRYRLEPLSWEVQGAGAGGRQRGIQLSGVRGGQ